MREYEGKITKHSFLMIGALFSLGLLFCAYKSERTWHSSQTDLSKQGSRNVEVLYVNLGRATKAMFFPDQRRRR